MCDLAEGWESVAMFETGEVGKLGVHLVGVGVHLVGVGEGFERSVIRCTLFRVILVYQPSYTCSFVSSQEWNEG